MLRSLTRGAVAAVAVAAGLLVLGGNTGAWGATTPGTATSQSPVVPAPPPTVSGTVAAVSPGSFILTLPGATSLTVLVTPATQFAETGAVTAPSGVSVGEQVTVTPVTDRWHPSSTLTAAQVLVVLTHAIGTVQSVGVGSFTLELVGGLVLPVTTTPTTAVRNAGVRQPGVYVGQYVTAYGAADPGDPSRLIAQFVVVTDPPPAPVASGPAGGDNPTDVVLVLGTVASVGSGSFVLVEAGGVSVTVETSPTTTYGETGSPTAPPGVAAGQQVRVTPAAGPPSPPSTLVAARVVVVLTQVTGTVQSVAATSFALQLFGGLVVAVDTTGAQVFAADGSPTMHVAAGQKVTAFGAADASVPSRLDARFVHVDPASGSDCGGGSGDDGQGGDDRGGDDQGGPPWGGHDGHDGSNSPWSVHGPSGGSWSDG